MVQQISAQENLSKTKISPITYTEIDGKSALDVHLILNGHNPITDSFGRLRVGEPLTLFDSKQISDNLPLFWDISGTANTGSQYLGSWSATMLSVGSAAAGSIIRRTFRRFNYQPGKSQLILNTFVLGSQQNGITKRVGYYDDRNGLYFGTTNGSLNFGVRTDTSSVASDTLIYQGNWNIDNFDGTGPSGYTLDPNKSQISFIEFEWLGVGEVKYGFFVDGAAHYAHKVRNSNNNYGVYMRTPNLPLQSEIINNGSGSVGSLMVICSSVITEGGQEETGIARYYSGNGWKTDADVIGSIYVTKAIRLKNDYKGVTVKELSANVIATTADNFEWMLIANPTIAGTFTFADYANSAVQVGSGDNSNIVTGGTQLIGGWAKSSVAIDKLLPNTFAIGESILGSKDVLALCVRPLGNNLDIYSGLTWREYL